MIKLAQKASAEELMASYVAFLRALYHIHQNAHWKVQGSESYGNHLLFQRLYEETQQSVDDAAEKTLGLFDKLADHHKVMLEIVDKFPSSSFEYPNIIITPSILKKQFILLFNIF